MSDHPQKSLFAHKQTYSRTGNSKSRSAGDVADEGERLDGACPHVKDPKPALIIEGMSPTMVVRTMDERIANQNKHLRALRKAFPKQKGQHRAIRVDTHVLIASVFSFPDSMEDMIEDDYLRWRADVITFAKEDAALNGAEVMSVFEHRDESHPHVHIFALPLCNGGNMRMDAKRCHEGHVAQAAHKSKNLAGSPSQSYKRAMSDWQDRYHEAVGAKHGQARTGPKRRRLDRATWNADKARLGAQKKTDQALRREAEATKAAEVAEARHKTALETSVSQMVASAELAHIIANEGLIEALKHQGADPKLIERLTAEPSQPPRKYDPGERAEMRPALYPVITNGIDRLRQPLNVDHPMQGFGVLFAQVTDWLGDLASSRPRWLSWGDLGLEVGREVKRALGLDYAPTTLARAIEHTPAWTGLVEQAQTGFARALGVRDRLLNWGSRSQPGND